MSGFVSGLRVGFLTGTGICSKARLASIHERAMCSRKYSRTAAHGAVEGIRACSNDNKFEIVKEEEIFKRFQTVYQRDIRYPNGEIVSFDIIANSASEHKSVIVFPFCTKTQTATLIREYQPGQNRESLSLVAGMYESGKHKDLISAARAELHEEAGLIGGELIELAQDVSASKYSMNKFYYFLAVDCVSEEIGERDAEEWISIVRGVSLKQVREIVEGGAMNLPNSLAALLALEELRRMGFQC